VWARLVGAVRVTLMSLAHQYTHTHTHTRTHTNDDERALRVLHALCKSVPERARLEVAWVVASCSGVDSVLRVLLACGAEQLPRVKLGQETVGLMLGMCLAVCCIVLHVC